MTVIHRDAYRANREQSITRRFAQARLRDRTVKPEYPIGATLTPTSRTKQYEGFGVKFGDLAGIHTNTPTLVETKPCHSAEALYSGVGQAIAKRALLAREHSLSKGDIETYVLFDNPSFAGCVESLPEMATVFAEVMETLGINWIVPAPAASKTQCFLNLQEELL